MKPSPAHLRRLIECKRRLVAISPEFSSETARLISQIGMTLCNLGEFYVFWSPSTRRMYARAAKVYSNPEQLRPRALGRPLVPADALCIGKYAQPATSADVLEDLADLLVAMPTNGPAPVIGAPIVPADPAPSVAQPRDMLVTRWKWTPRTFNSHVPLHEQERAVAAVRGSE